MLAEYPSTEVLLYNRLELLDEYQRCQYDLMARISNILNRTISEKTDPITGRCIPMPFLEFLDSLYLVIYENSKHNYEDEWVVLDDFMQIAEFSFSAIKHLVDNPSHNLIRQESNLPVNKAKRVDGKVMQWLARRPGATVKEKIAPEFKVRTTKTVFSVNTKENQELKYLYKVLQHAIRVRIKRIKDNEDSDVFEHDKHYQLLQKMLMFNMKIRKSELGDVPARKQSIQNNKLMCDPNYKIVWDATQKISKLEKDLKANWMSLQEQSCQLAYWYFLAVLRNKKKVIISDALGYLHYESVDGKNKLAFLGNNSDGTSDVVFTNDSCCRIALPYDDVIEFMDVRIANDGIECSTPVTKRICINIISENVSAKIVEIQRYKKVLQAREQARKQYEQVPGLLNNLVTVVNKILSNRNEKINQIKSLANTIVNIINNQILKEVATDEKETLQ